MGLTKQTRLQRAPELKVDIAGTEVTVHGARGRTTGGPELLAALAQFEFPCTLARGVDELARGGHGRTAFIDASRAVLDLAQIGALVALDGSRPQQLPVSAKGFDDASVHIRMLDDEVRTQGYLEAIERTVREGDVVVDLGTGTGVLAVAAAQAGAKRVYAIERTAVARCAEMVFEENRVDDRVTLLRGDSSRVDLPERADVLMTETFDNNLFGERAVEHIVDARERFLKPSARMIPRRVRAFGELVSIDRTTLGQQRFTPEAARRWNSRYGIKFSALTKLSQPSGRWFAAKRTTAFEWQRLGPSALLADIDLANVRFGSLERSTSFRPGRDGVAHGVLFWFELELAGGIVVSTRPRANARSSWRCPVWLAPRPREVAEGEAIDVELRVRGCETVVQLG